MAFDPYRILGVQPGASQLEIKRAYRQLVKTYHPDSAGAGEIQRFLTIQRAYELLTSPTARRFPRSVRPTPAPATDPWRADPDRARATRERARRRGAGLGTDAPGGGTAPRDPGSAGPATDRAPGTADDRTGAARPGSGEGTTGAPDGTPGAGGGRGRGRRRPTRKATFGSTTYDEAREQADPTWQGASWYGPTLGEYWTVNPREYADPRKHGPEYLARARRPLGRGRPGEAARPSVSDEPAADEVAVGPARPSPSTADASLPRTGDPSTRGEEPSGIGRREVGPWPPNRERRASPLHTSAVRGASSRFATRGNAGAAGARSVASARSRSVDEPPSAAGPWFAGLAPEARDPLRRFILTLIAWPPLGIAAATALGSATGCADASATCTDASRLLPWIAQAAILGVLFALPTLAAILAAGSVTALVASVPVTAVLVALGANYDPPHATVVLTVLLAIAWVAGVAFASGRRWRNRGGWIPPGSAGSTGAPLS